MIEQTGNVNLTGKSKLDKGIKLNEYNFSAPSFYNSSIFTGNINKTQDTSETELEKLEQEFLEVQENQGMFSNAFNGVKEFTGLGTSAAKCEDTIEKYKNGEITYEEALAEIENFESKQDSGLNLLSNIATSFAAIGAVAAAVATGGALTPLAVAVIGAGAGAVTKAGVKLADRATNKVKGDDFDADKIARDALSGAVTGGIAAATMGTGAAKATIKESVLQGAKSSAKTGLITGSVSGSSNYLIDCAFDEDKDFKADEFLGNTALNAVVGGTVGAIVGGTNGALRFNGSITHGGKAIINGKAANISARDVIANGNCSTAHKVLNKAIKDVAA